MTDGLLHKRQIDHCYDGSSNNHVVFNGDAAELLRAIPSESIDLVITSPPYNIGKAYEQAASLGDYLDANTAICGELVRVLAPTGSLCWQVGNFVDKGEVFPLDIPYYNIFKGFDLQLRNRIIWTFNHGLHASHRFSGRYETILWFSKTADYVFNLDPVRVPSKYPDKRHYKGEKRGQLSGNPLGKNPSDIWRIVSQDWENEIWDIPNVKANHPEKTSHPCQYPVELVQRCILALTDDGGTVLDPFGGVGSAVIGAESTNRRGIMAEMMPEYCENAERRLLDFQSGTLRVRPLGKPIHEPKATP